MQNSTVPFAPPSKIEVAGGIKYLEFNRPQGEGQVIFNMFPDKIDYFGEVFIKRFWPHDRDVIIYSANPVRTQCDN